jgi:hypothetical protein
MLNFCQEDILAISKRDELFKVYHEVGDCGEFYYAQSINSKQYGLLLADCVKHVVSIIIIIILLQKKFNLVRNKREKKITGYLCHLL